MELHIKNNYAPNIEVRDNGTLNLYQDSRGQWRQRQERDDIGDAEIVEEMNGERCSETTATDLPTSIGRSEPRRATAERIMALIDRGDWVNDTVAAGVRTMMSEALDHSEALWRLLENGRGDRVRTVWQNIVGYLADKKLFNKKGSPMLNKDFFGNNDGYANIDKGRPSRDNMSAGFRDVLPVLDKYAPKK